ncbi:MAG: hypothetical protein ACFB4I_09860 [Cyanophyceae cyanobacterium]
MKLKLSKLWLSLFLYRAFYSVAGQIIIPGLTSLGDSKRYQRASLPQGFGFLFEKTLFTDTVGAFFATITGRNVFLINLCFQSIAFIGIYRFLSSLDSSERKLALPLLLLPSFTLWSSVASKEAIFVFAMGIICGYISDMYKGRDKLQWYDLIAFYLLLLYKPHYAIAVAIVLVATKLSFQFVSQDRIWFATIVPLLSLVPLYIFRQKIVELSFQVEAHFAGGESSRGAFWVEQYDVFNRAFEGMLISFIGPKLSEVLTEGSILFAITFLESMAILIYLIYMLVRRRVSKIPLERYAIGISGLLWLMFVTYPTGVINPGSAIRYRTNYFLFVVLIFAVILRNSSYYRAWVAWVKSIRRQQLADQQMNIY